MAYGLKYRFTFRSSNGADMEIDVKQDGYSGTVTRRALGSAPVLRQQAGGCVLGSSLAFTPECIVDGEFSQFYTTDAKEFLVELYRNETMIWSGFIVPELYSEPDIAPPYDVDITAADGLGELKRYDFLPLGKVTLQALFTNLLGYTGQSLPVNFISQLSYSGVSAEAFFIDTYIDVDYKAGKTCYDVLQYLLATFHATVCYYDGGWLITRENDIAFNASDEPEYITSLGAADSFADGLMEVTAMGAGGLWPVEFTSSSVDPALKSVKVTAPWNLVSGLKNSGMLVDANWTKSANASFNSTIVGYALLPNAYISQTKSQLMSKQLLLAIDAAAYIYRPNNVKKYSEAILQVTFTPSGGTAQYLAEDDQGGIIWNASASTIKFRIESGKLRDTATRNEVNLPVVLDSNGDPVSGTISIKISASESQGLYLYGAYLTVAAEDGYQDTLFINNGARGEADEVEVAVGYETSELANHKDYYGGILLDGDSDLITSLSTGNFSNLDFLSLISRDYARSIALPRLRTDGTLNTPGTLEKRPLLVYCRGTYRWLETFEWNLLEDNLDFSALSIPSAALTVSDEVITATGSASGSAANTIGRITPGGGGDEGLTILLTNYAHIFQAWANGTAVGGTDTIGVKAFKGGSAVAATVGTITGQASGMSTSVSDNGTTAPVITVSVMSGMYQAQGSLTIPVTADGVTINLSYSWTLARQGDPGTDGYNTATVTLYKRASTIPSAPSGTLTYTFSSGAISGNLEGWTKAIPETDGFPLWAITSYPISRNSTATLSSWDGPVKILEDGAQGPAGASKVYPFRGEWDENETYYGNGQRQDIVKYNDLYYMAVEDAGEIFSSTTPDESDDWEEFGASYSNVATGFLFAESASIQSSTIYNAIIQWLRTADAGARVEARDNWMAMFDSTGLMKLKISSENIVAASGTTTITVPTTTGVLEELTDTAAKQGGTVNGSGTLGTVTVSSASNQLEVPAIPVRLRIGSGIVSAGSIRARCTFVLTSDDVPIVSVQTGWLAHPIGSTAATSDFTFPAIKATLDIGEHTIGWTCAVDYLADASYVTDSGIEVSAYVQTTSTLTLSYAEQLVEIGANGFRAIFTSNYMLQAVKTGAADSTIQMLMQAGNYGVEVTSAGLKFRIGGTWYNCSTATISGNTVLKLTT